MGFGDWIMATADAKRLHKETGKRVAFGDGKTPYWEPQVFMYNPKISKDGKDAVWCRNHPQYRPYIEEVTKDRVIFNDDFRASAGEIFLSPAEVSESIRKAPTSPYIVVEPYVKTRFDHGVNKSWPYWEELLALADLPWLQLGTSEPMTRKIRTDTFREAMGVLRGAALFVGTDGGLHHAAAALGIPAVVIWTGFTSPKHLGYDSHINLYAGGDPCGTLHHTCPHCRRNAESISPEQVLASVERLYEERIRHLAS